MNYKNTLLNKATFRLDRAYIWTRGDGSRGERTFWEYSSC